MNNLKANFQWEQFTQLSVADTFSMATSEFNKALSELTKAEDIVTKSLSIVLSQLLEGGEMVISSLRSRLGFDGTWYVQPTIKFRERETVTRAQALGLIKSEMKRINKESASVIDYVLNREIDGTVDVNSSPEIESLWMQTYIYAADKKEALVS